MALELRRGEKVYLRKGNDICFDLTWAAPKTTGFIRSKNVKLDFGCLYQLQDGRKGCIQDLGKNHGNANEPPYIELRRNADGDECLVILGDKLQYVRKLLVFAFFYEGAPKWRDAQACATVTCEGNEDLIIKLDEHDASKHMCAIARIKNRDDGTVSVKKVVEFFKGHEDMDAEFKWGLRWVEGSKD